MSVKQMSLVWELDLPQNQKLILLAYADHADDDGDNVYPSLGRVAYKTGYSVDQVRRISRQLVKDKLMERVSEGRGRGNPHRYKLALGKGSKLPPFKAKGSTRQKVASDEEKVASEPIKGGIAMPPEPSLEPSSLEPSCSPKGAAAPLKAHNLNAKLIDRCDEVGFEPNKRQKDGWAKELKTRLEENQPIDQLHASMAKIVEAASNGYYWSFKKAEQGPPGKRNGHASGNPPANLDNVVDIASNTPEAAARRQEGYEWAFK